MTYSVDRKTVSENITTGINVCKEQLKKKEFTDTDVHKIRVVRNLTSLNNGHINLIGQENAERKMDQVDEKMKILGYKK